MGTCPGAAAHVQPEGGSHNTFQLPPGTPPEDVWRAEGVQTPHDFALTAAPTPSKGNGDRAVAVLIAETRLRGSSLRKFILLPEGDGGTSDPAPETEMQGFCLQEDLLALSLLVPDLL